MANKRALSIEEVKRRLKDHEFNIEIVESTYTKVNARAIFIDPEYGEWQAFVGNVLYQDAKHPARKQQRTIKTWKKKYGVDKLSNINVEKRLQTCVDRYGVPHPLMNNNIYQQTRNNNTQTKYVDVTAKKLANRLRTRLSDAVTNRAKWGSAVSDLGCSIDELKTHLESKFQPGMTWDNYGKYGWHIDHIIPLSFFDLGVEKEFLKACHYTNLQPLWAKDNLQKSNKTDWTIEGIDDEDNRN